MVNDYFVMQILQQLISAKFSTTALKSPVTQKPGIYAFFLEEPMLGTFTVQSEYKIIYIGETERNLAERLFDEHLKSGKTGRSALRRNIGAVLKGQLSLKAVARSKRKSSQDIYCYRFTYDGEEKLTKWMKEKLQVSVYPYNLNLKTLEDALIARAEPIMNLTGWTNPYKNQIEELKEICRQEARHDF